MGLGGASTGCAAIAKAAASDPAALAVILPLAIGAEIARAAAKRENAKPSNGMLTVTPGGATANPLAFRDWRDPDDWVAACDGPMLCGDQEHFQCSGEPGNCYCDCVGDWVPDADPPRPPAPVLVRAK